MAEEAGILAPPERSSKNPESGAFIDDVAISKMAGRINLSFGDGPIVERKKD